MVICDANYCFTLFDLGQYGSNNDSGILVNSKMGDLFETNSLNVPGDSNLDDSSIFPTRRQNLSLEKMAHATLPRKKRK